MDSSLINSSLSSAFLGFIYVAYKLFKKNCKSKCTDTGLQVEINLLESKISQKLDDHKDKILNDLVEKLNNKIETKLSPSNASTPALNSASAPTISESEKIDL